MTVKRRFALGTAASVTAEIINRLLPLLTLSMAQQRLGLDAFGQALFAIFLVDCTTPFIEAGTNSFGQIAIGQGKDANTTVSEILAMRLINATIAALALAGIVLTFYEEYLGITLALSFMLLSSAIEMSYFHIGRQRVWLLNIFSVTAKILTLAAVMFLVHGPADVTTFAVVNIGGNGLIALATCTMALLSISLRPVAHLGALYRRLLPFAGTVLLFYAIDKFDFLVVESRGIPSEIGLYGGAGRLFQSIQGLAAPLVVVFGAAMLSVTDHQTLRRYSSLAVTVASIVLLPIAVGAHFVGGDLLAMIFDETYQAAGPIFVTMCTGAIPFSFLLVYGVYILQPQDRLKALNAALAFALVIGVGASVFLAKLFGAHGVAWSVVIAKVVAAAVVYRSSGVTLDGALWGRGAAAALIMGIALWLLKLEGLFVSIAIGASIYGVMLGLLFGRELKPMVQRLISKTRQGLH